MIPQNQAALKNRKPQIAQGQTTILKIREISVEKMNEIEIGFNLDFLQVSEICLMGLGRVDLTSQWILMEEGCMCHLRLA